MCRGVIWTRIRPGGGGYGISESKAVAHLRRQRDLKRGRALLLSKRRGCKVEERGGPTGAEEGEERS